MSLLLDLPISRVLVEGHSCTVDSDLIPVEIVGQSRSIWIVGDDGRVFISLRINVEVLLIMTMHMHRIIRHGMWNLLRSRIHESWKISIGLST